MKSLTYANEPNRLPGHLRCCGNLPTFIAVLLAWMNSNARLSDIKSDLQRQISDLRTDMKEMKSDLLRESSNTRELLRNEFHRVGEVIDARLKHLEERD